MAFAEHGKRKTTKAWPLTSDRITKNRTWAQMQKLEAEYWQKRGIYWVRVKLTVIEQAGVKPGIVPTHRHTEKAQAKPEM